MNDPCVFIVDIDMVTKLKKVRHYVISKRSINYTIMFSIGTREKNFGCVFSDLASILSKILEGMGMENELCDKL